MTHSDTLTVETPPEIELLLLCARTRVNSETAAKVETLVQEGIDWNYLLETAQEHGVMPLLYWNLNATCPEAVLRTTLDRLRSYLHTNAQRNVFMAGELLRLLSFR